ncbi:hypothetical protein, partial [Rhizobium sp. CCGE 510]|uniref:hypothetical protein n=1 Tax=Rhizobium sp. CCGE 510 TaxID=1132836 RepID=UPI001AEBCE27
LPEIPRPVIAGGKAALSLAMVAPRSQAHHNLKAAGSNPAPATKKIARCKAGFCVDNGSRV